MTNEVNVNFIDLYCPKCKSRLLSNGEKIWCSYVGSGSPYYPACDYGIKEHVYVRPQDQH